MAPLDHLVYPVSVAFKDSLYGSIAAVLDPSVDPDSEGRFPGMVAKEYSLNPAFDYDPRSHFVWYRSHPCNPSQGTLPHGRL